MNKTKYENFTYEKLLNYGRYLKIYLYNYTYIITVDTYLSTVDTYLSRYLHLK